MLGRQLNGWGKSWRLLIILLNTTTSESKIDMLLAINDWRSGFCQIGGTHTLSCSLFLCCVMSSPSRRGRGAGRSWPRSHRGAEETMLSEGVSEWERRVCSRALYLRDWQLSVFEVGAHHCPDLEIIKYRAAPCREVLTEGRSSLLKTASSGWKPSCGPPAIGRAAATVDAGCSAG